MPKLSFIMWHSPDPRVAAAFYAQFGISFIEERHGSGPVHFAFQSSGFAIELYPAKDGAPPGGTGTVVGFEVNDADQVSAIAASQGIEVVEDLKMTAMGRRVIIRDPDGRQVFLFSPA